MENEFLNRITVIIEKNISNELFGVSELAREVGMSRSNLLRKIKNLTNLSASQFISQVRLKNAKELLKEKSLTVSEVSFKVGFNSTSYFIKCFREFYGYPPGEEGKHEPTVEVQTETKRRPDFIVLISSFLVLALLVTLFILKPFSVQKRNPEKSIAVLPFKNDSSDSSNVYIINGLMESILITLQHIEDLKVISRTSVEKYRNSNKTIPEIAKELKVNYLVEGSGQKMGDQILLHIQLIEGKSDNHLWAESYDRESKDIFNLQKEVAKNIADKIEAVISPEEERRIDKNPTENLVAYDHFLKGLDILQRPNRENLHQAIPYFQEAIKNDTKFARAYAGIAMTYYFLEEGQEVKKYSDSINFYADKALFYDSEIPQSVIAKGLYYMNSGEYVPAANYFERALEFNPNHDLAIALLVNLYVNYIPDTEKYLEYALKGIQLDIASYDSLTVSIIYLHISNAFIQNGFITEAEKYINKSLEYDTQNLYSEMVKAYILFAKNHNLKQTRDLLISALKKDTSRIDIVQEIGKIYYYMRDYESAYQYYKPFTEIRKEYNLGIFKSEDIKIAMVFSETGKEEEATEILANFKEYAGNDESVYKHISLAGYYSYLGEKEKALQHLKTFSEQDHYFYWVLLFTPIDPLFDNIKDSKEFKQIFKEIENRFWKNHERLKSSLKKKKLISIPEERLN